MCDFGRGRICEVTCCRSPINDFPVMILFVRNIPVNTHISELQQYVTSGVKRSFPFRSGRVLKAEILVIQDKRTKAFEFHGLVFVDSDKTGQRAIQKLKGKRFKNKLVLVREYHHRTWHNDRRFKQEHVPNKFIEKRVTDRRRGSGVEVFKDLSRIFSSPEDFARKLI